MKIKEHYNHLIPRLLKTDGVTFGNHIFYAISEQEVSKNLRNHELVHVAQYQSLGVFKFLILYVFEYIVNRLKGLSHYDAYYAISFEVEARR